MTVLDRNPAPLVTRVVEATLPLLEQRRRFSVIARQLGYSEETLRRRLREHGLNYMQLLKTTRQELMHRNFEKDPRLSVTEVGWRIGYTESSSFSNACKRWTGCTPKQIRKEYRNHV